MNLKYSLLTVYLLSLGMGHASTDVITVEQEQSISMNTQDDLNRSFFKAELTDLDVLQQEYHDTPMTVLDICRIAITGCAEIYLTLHDGEKDDLIKMAVELATLRSMVENYCDGCLKEDPIIKKYKDFMHLDSMNLHATIGCTSYEETTKYEEITPFSIKTFLKNPTVQEFYATLDEQEKKRYKEIVKGMNSFCQDITQTIDTIVNNYPTLKEKLKEAFQHEGLHVIMTIEFDQPFPSTTYQLL